MTEPEVASSDATNIQSSIARDGDECDQRAQMVDVGRGRPAVQDRDLHGQDRSVGAHAQAAVDDLVPMDAKGVTVKRMLNVFGYDDAPHGHAEVTFENVRVPASNILLGEGAASRSRRDAWGGADHHCMRTIGMAERSLEAMCRRVKHRVAFGGTLAEMGRSAPTSPNRGSK